MEPAWSPDRSRIVFVREVVVGEDFRGDYIYRADLTVMNANGSGVQRIAVRGTDPVWSPDGGRIAFVSGIDNGEIWTIGPDGRGARRLGMGSDPAWSPDGGMIAFERWTGDQTELFLMDANGRAKRKLVPGFTKGEYSAPAWSPNGQQIAFLRCVCEIGDIRTSLYTVNRSGRGLRRLVGGVSTKDISAPKWSPDGSMLLFERGPGAGPDSTFVINARGDGLRRIATNTDYPDWSPDGRSIAFATGHPGRVADELRVASAAGGPSRRIAKREDVRDVDW